MRRDTPAGDSAAAPAIHGFERHVVLVAPEIHWNTGNIGRTCLAAGAFLHLVKPIGFSLDSREVKRAGLDYWHRVDLTVWDSFEDLLDRMAAQAGELAFFSKHGVRPFWSLPSPARLLLVFGSETRGLPAPLLARYEASSYYIPLTPQARSLNLSTAVGIALYESLRRTQFFHAWQRT